ncbi:hypothetical protein EBT25_01800 [bacterium]|jgi:hypothetical protein|nr:hypothetical protein [bacterium]
MITGPGYDLEHVFVPGRVPLIPEPAGIPFHKQAGPIPDFQQVHTSYKEVTNMEDTMNPTYNNLPYANWIGTSTRQINKGGPGFYLGVNEDRQPKQSR